MEAFSVEKSLLEGDKEVKELFNFVRDNAQEFEAYEIEKAIFAKLMKIGYTAMKCYFAEKCTGDNQPFSLLHLVWFNVKDRPALHDEENQGQNKAGTSPGENPDPVHDSISRFFCLSRAAFVRNVSRLIYLARL